jgi:hypothetical protein
VGTTRKGKGAPSTAKKALPYVAGAVIVVAALVAGVFWPRDGWVPINDAYALDGRTLLVVGNSGSDVDVRRWSTIGLLGPDGVISRSRR